VVVDGPELGFGVGESDGFGVGESVGALLGLPLDFEVGA